MTMDESFFYWDVEAANFSETSGTVIVNYSGLHCRYGRNY